MRRGQFGPKVAHAPEAEECDEHEERPERLLHENRDPEHVNLRVEEREERRKVVVYNIHFLI